jgi:hypothetical protein
MRIILPRSVVGSWPASRGSPPPPSVPHRDPEVAVGAEVEVARLVVRDPVGLLDVEDRELAPGVGGIRGHAADPAEARDPRVALPRLSGGLVVGVPRIVDVEEAVGRIVGMEGEPEQAALAGGDHAVGDVQECDGLDGPVRLHHPDLAVPVDDEQASVAGVRDVDGAVDVRERREADGRRRARDGRAGEHGGEGGTPRPEGENAIVRHGSSFGSHLSIRAAPVRSMAGVLRGSAAHFGEALEVRRRQETEFATRAAFELVGRAPGSPPGLSGAARGSG